MKRFIVEPLWFDDERYIVKDTKKGWFIVMPTEHQANFVRERFEEILGESANE